MFAELPFVNAIILVAVVVLRHRTRKSRHDPLQRGDLLPEHDDLLLGRPLRVRHPARPAEGGARAWVTGQHRIQHVVEESHDAKPTAKGVGRGS